MSGLISAPRCPYTKFQVLQKFRNLGTWTEVTISVRQLIFQNNKAKMKLGLDCNMDTNALLQPFTFLQNLTVYFQYTMSEIDTQLVNKVCTPDVQFP